MTDWKEAARAAALDIADADLDRVAGPLAAMEESFRPLAAQLMAADEPATVFSAEETV